MFLIHNLFALFSIVIIIIIGIQLVDFITNYDYIVRYVNKYSKWEFVTSPSMNVIDKTVFDPNTEETDKANKWRCVLWSFSKWSAIKQNAVQSNTQGVMEFSSFEECNLQLFSNPIITQETPIAGSAISNFIHSYDWSS